MKGLKDSYSLARASLSVIGKDKRIITAQIFGMICLVLITAVVGASLYVLGYFERVEISDLSFTELVTLHSVVAFIVWYFASLCVYYITEAYISACALQVVRKEGAVVDTPRIREYLVPLLQFALISGTVGIFIRALEDKFPWFGSLSTYLALGAWNLATVFAVVAIVDKQANTGIEATKKSVSILSQSFGENIIVRVSVGVVLTLGILLWLLVFVAVIPLLAVVLLGNLALAGWLAGIGVIGLILLLFMSTVFDSVLTVMLYEYTRTGKEVAALDKELFRKMITSKKASAVFSH